MSHHETTVYINDDKYEVYATLINEPENNYKEFVVTEFYFNEEEFNFEELEESEKEIIYNDLWEGLRC